ncbi:hypothetical protein A2810_00065 [candidate division Kazan bacterium RIFCSPHIGHO2_01_FULL_49_10]|nr:MAG: hypothetical protein A2810_00065 [candidate division Kazan bacterium RIFCSPHIGHO2_01_FULL_49_10]
MKSFCYPDGRLMCRSGQERAAREAWILMNGSEEEKQEILNRAGWGEHASLRGADTDKHNLISLAVATLYLSSELTDYVDPETGEFIVSSYSGLMRISKKCVD